MKGLTLCVFVFSITMLKNRCFAQYSCWPYTDILPCELVSTGIICSGNTITDLNQFPKHINVSYESYRYCGPLIISNTLLTKIGENAFSDFAFGRIELIDNIHLESIHRNAFKASADSRSLGVLVIKNSPKLVSPKDLFSMINALQSATHVDLSGLGIEEIPDDAFSGNTNMQAIYMMENSNLKKIGKYIIYNLASLQIMRLTSNIINEISSEAFTIKTRDTVIPRIELNYNELTDTSFNENWVNVHKNLSHMYTINLSNNDIKSIPESSFKSVLLSQSVRLILSGNNIRCDCKVKWIKVHETEQLKESYESMKCANKMGQSITSLKLEDFGVC